MMLIILYKCTYKLSHHISIDMDNALLYTETESSHSLKREIQSGRLLNKKN